MYGEHVEILTYASSHLKLIQEILDEQDKLIESEKNHRKERLLPHYQNDVWERRQKPPENWNVPLPEWMQEEFKNSFLHLKNEELKGNKIADLDRKCTIM